jgi:hypothetical protein
MHNPDMGLRVPAAKAELGLPIMVPSVEMIASPLVICDKAEYQLRRMLSNLAPGDVVTVTRVYRLARSTRDLLNTLAAITEKNAGFRSLGDAWADTTTADGRLMLTLLGGLAEFERDLIRTRTSQGRARAEARGVKLGRKPKTYRASTARGAGEDRGRRDAAQRCPQLQCQSGDYFTAHGVKFIENAD